VLAIFTGCLGFVFWRLSFRPLWHTDVWGHLTYGRLIWQTGAIPATEPILPLAAGMPFVDSAWLSQVLAYGAFSLWGVAALQFLFAAGVTACLGLLLGRIYLRTHSTVFAFLGAAIFAALDWQQLLAGWPEMAALMRPQLAGLAAFTLLFVLLTRKTASRSDWVGIPTLVALWANLHGSFVMGLGLLGCFAAGRALDLLRRTGSLQRVWRNSGVRRLVLLTELSAAAALLNPYGLGLYAEVLNFASSPNLADLVEWEQLSIHTWQGQAAGLAALGLAMLYRLSPRRVTAAELLLLIGLGAWTLWTSRILIWWALPAAYYSALHGHAAWRKLRKQYGEPIIQERRGLWSVVTLLLIWVFLAGSSFGVRVLHGKPPELKRSVSQATPTGATAYLREHPPQGQVFNTCDWGDYLIWAGPPGMQVFADTHVHLIPVEVWQQYQLIISGSADWSDLLDRFGVNTAVVDVPLHSGLISRLRESSAWKVSYEDGLAVVFTRRKPID
jgi:hypothetical protein